MSEEATIGYVYILENDSMPGLIKIGKTARGSIERASELSATTGVPTPFKVAFELPSEKYEKLEREMHSRLANHRVASNREFFEYPIDKAINLLKKLDIEKQNGTRQEVAKDQKNLITHMLDFFKRFLQPNPEKFNKTEIDDKESSEIETGRESVEPNPPATLSEPSINYIIKDKPLQNEYRENAVDTNLNGKPYYTEDNGFSCAAALRGMPEALPEHIGIIIRNEQLEIEASREQLQSDIKQLDDEKNKLVVCHI